MGMHGIPESGVGHKARRILAIGMATASVIGVGMVLGIQLATAPQVKADRAYWTVTGPPCPTATQADLDRIPRPLAQMSDFGEGRFQRISGAVMCVDMTTGLGVVTGTVCQFNAPRALKVWSKGGAAMFQFPFGQAATVTVSDDRPPRCVAAARAGWE
jgi:hypothetical protein